MKLITLLVVSVIITFTAFVIIIADQTCTPTYDGGYSCYNYDDGSFSTITPDYGGGYTIYDFNHPNQQQHIPKPYLNRGLKNYKDLGIRR